MILSLKRASANNKHSKTVLTALAFVLLILLSFIYHLPASWALQQLQQQQPLPPQLQISQVQGTIWDAQAQLSWRESQQSIALGKLHWQLSGWALLSLRTQLDFNLDRAQGGVRGTLSSGLLNQQQLQLSAVNGLLPLAELQPLMPREYRNLGKVQGELQLMDLDLTWDQGTGWITAVGGALQLSQLDIMGAGIPAVELRPSMMDSSLKLAAQGSGQGWQLAGEALIGMENYQLDFAVKAENSATMPDWTDLLMQRKSPVLAIFEQRGRR